MAIFKTLKKTHAVIIEQPSTYYEKDKKGKVVRKRQIQYVAELDTIFVDEQRQQMENPKSSPIYITRSILKVEDDNRPLLEFMEKHSDNEANGGRVFKLMDIEKEEIYEVERFESMDKARSLLSEANDTLVRAIAVWFLGTSHIDQRIPKLKITLRNKLDMNLKLADGKTDFATALIDFINDKNSDEKLLITVALKENIIKIVNGKSIAWEGDEVIYIGSQAGNVVQEFAVWAKNDEEGRSVLKIITEKINHITKGK